MLKLNQIKEGGKSMSRDIPIEEIQRKIKEIENKTLEEFFSEIRSRYAFIYVSGYKDGKRQALKELLNEV